MRFKVHYGRGTEDVTVPDTCKLEVLEGKDSGDVDEDGIIRKAIDNPLDSPALEEFLEGGRLLIFTNDGDKPTPTSRMLGTMIDRIKDRPDTKILVGCGTHKPPTQEDYDQIFGEYYEMLKDRIHHNVAKDEEKLFKVGVTRRGNEIYMNKLVEWADKILITGSVEPHYFAGFTGGRKWVIGAGGFWTIERNHKMALRSEAAILALKGNPIHEELVEWNRLVDKPKFCINVVQDNQLKVVGCFAGDIERVHEECVKLGMDVYTAKTRGNGDILITVARPPRDIDLYQALSVQEQGNQALKEGGVLILVAECKRGMGPTHFAAMLKGLNVEEVLKEIELDYHLGHHKIAKLLNTLKKSKVWVVTDLDAKDVSTVQMTKFATVQEALDAAFEVVGEEARIIFLPDGGMTIPRVEC